MRPPEYAPDPRRHGAPELPGYMVIFDGGCDMCQGWVGRLRRWDREGVLTFAPYQDPSIPELLPWIPGEAFADAVQVVAPDGRTWSGAGAVEVLAEILPGGRPLALLFRIPLVRVLADDVYRRVAARRRRKGCSLHGS
ncbi:MAG TPA: DUF393 domain-containing protein [Longimicrobiales bacterium]|nr:DUF393 domain-containing protein [Longimicrobiales bacterium]